jgi:S-adenosylmethionine decarboxylase
MRKFLFCCVFLGLVNFNFLVADETYAFKGVHFLASYSECDHAALTDIDALREAMMKAVEESGATILKSEDYVFPPDGFTMVVLLSESHASIHTYPEYDACFIDLFTCGEKCSAQRFDQALRKYLQPRHVSEKTLLRTDAIEERE